MDSGQRLRRTEVICSVSYSDSSIDFLVRAQIKAE